MTPQELWAELTMAYAKGKAHYYAYGDTVYLAPDMATANAANAGIPACRAVKMVNPLSAFDRASVTIVSKIAGPKRRIKTPQL